MSSSLTLLLLLCLVALTDDISLVVSQRSQRLPTSLCSFMSTSTLHGNHNDDVVEVGVMCVVVVDVECGKCFIFVALMEERENDDVVFEVTSVVTTTVVEYRCDSKRETVS